MVSRLVAFLIASALPAAAFAREIQPVEPVAIPPSIQQGIDLIYVDPEIAPAIEQREPFLRDLGLRDQPGAPVDLFASVHPLYTQLRRALVRYRMRWGSLPQVPVPAGPLLKKGAVGERVALLRQRLGLGAAGGFDDELAAVLRRYQQAHALKPDGMAGDATIASLNLGAVHYERLVMLNLERAKRLPPSSERGRYIVVDVGAAEIYLFEDGRRHDRMKAIVGKAASATPMMAALIRYASVNPYWNVPPDLVQKLIAPRVLTEGSPYLESRRYQVLSDWTDAATVVDPATIDWPAVAAGTLEIRVRQLPGSDNSMGAIKFMMPNDFGIYLHDTPNKAPFLADDRWISNGCVRVEDARRLAAWLFGEMPTGSDPQAEEKVDLQSPVPVYITYLTAAAANDGEVAFRADPYQRDDRLLTRYFAATSDALPAPPQGPDARAIGGETGS